MWTAFKDMHSGGSRTLDWEEVLIEAPVKEAEIIFQNIFDHNPYRVSCTCCGPDYSVFEYGSLEEALLNRWSDKGGFKVVRASDIKADDRRGELREEGYMWRD